MDADANISMLFEFIGNNKISRDKATRLLKLSNNNLEAAASTYFEKENEPGALDKYLSDSTPGAWDGTAFGSGRYGEEDAGASVPTFNIDYAPGFDVYPHSGNQSTAPTRPPSPSSEASALSTHHGDAPMQSIEQTQESGVIGTSPRVFGPATKDFYDSASWAMVPSSTANAIIPDPDPQQRKRVAGEPAILKPSPNFNYLPALIAILHSIPLYRNAFLAPNISTSHYWMGDEWWRGSPEMPTRILDTADLSTAFELDVIHELQRLMAFLDKSDRAYATAGSLMELDAWKQSQGPLDPDDDLLRFLMLWSASYEAQHPNTQLDGWIRSIVNLGSSQVQNFVLDTNVTRGALTNLSLYDVLDQELFSANIEPAHIMSISQVLILRLISSRTDAKDLGCRIPATLYVDRYLERNKPVIEHLHRDYTAMQEVLDEIERKTKRLAYHIPRKENPKPLDTLKMLETSMKAFKPKKGDEDPSAKDAATLAQLQELHQSIESRLAALKSETDQMKKAMDQISSRFKPVIDDGAEDLIDFSDISYPEGQTPQDAMHHPYHIRGVATHLGVVYLLHPDTNTPEGQQWWRVQYDTDSASPTIRRDRVTQQEVIERASTESSNALLVYAHKEATSVPDLPLSEALEEFVKKDNLLFMEELQKSHTGWEDVDYDTTADMPRGGWDQEPPGYIDHDWNDMSATEFHRGENFSDATLTPATDTGVREMVEINGGMDAMTGVSRASSVTVGREDERTERAAQAHGVAGLVDVDMDDAQDDMRVQHIEVAEKKKGG